MSEEVHYSRQSMDTLQEGTHQYMHSDTPNMDTRQEEELYSPGTNNAHTYVLCLLYIYTAIII